MSAPAVDPAARSMADGARMAEATRSYGSHLRHRYQAAILDEISLLGRLTKINLLLLLILATVTASAQDKPRVFIQGKGSENVRSNGGAGGGKHWAAWGSKSTIDSHDESMEVTKDLQKNQIKFDQARADGMHLLRRTSGSLVCRRTADVKLAQEWLGHSSSRITMDTYVHLMKDAQKQTAQAVFTRPNIPAPERQN